MARTANQSLPHQSQPPLALDASTLDEIEQIGLYLDSMSSYLDQASDLAELGVFSSMFAHEVNNLMTQVGGRAQLALMNMDRPELVLKALTTACHASTQIAQLSEIFLESAQHDTPQSTHYRVKEIHQHALAFVADADITRFGCSFNETSDDLRISLPPTLLQQVLLNLYLNAIRAIEATPDPSLGVISTTVERIESSVHCSPWNIPLVRITVHDNGIGMSARQIEQLVPTHTQRKTPSASLRIDPPVQIDAVDNEHDCGRGHGLGLVICKKLISDAGGSIRANSTPGVGTTMVVTLPEAQPASSPIRQSA